MTGHHDQVRLDHPAITVLGGPDHTTVTCLCGATFGPTTTHTARYLHRSHQTRIARTPTADELDQETPAR